MRGVTDVTGFGLLGHGWEMADRSGARFVFDSASVPLYDGALQAAEAGVRTGGDARNRDHLDGQVDSTADPAARSAGLRPADVGRAAGGRRPDDRG